MHRDTTWTCKLRVTKNGHIHFRTSKLLGLLPERDSGRDGQRLLVCGKNSEVGTRGRLVVGVQGGHLKMGDGQRPCSIYGTENEVSSGHAWGTVSSPCWCRLVDGGQRRDLNAKRLFLGNVVG